jgi:hypothetical protein
MRGFGFMSFSEDAWNGLDREIDGLLGESGKKS